MSLNIIELIKGQLGSALISQAASEFGESESGVSKAISGLLPAVIGGLANNANKPEIINTITGAASSGLLGNLLGEGSSNNSVISTVLSAIFGDKVGGLVNAVSGFSGVSNSTSNSLLSMVTSAALGSIGKYSTDNNLDASGITKLLEDQKGIVSTLLPAGLSLASLGLGNWFGGETIETEKVTVTSFDQPKTEVNRGGNTPINVDRNQNNNEGGSIWKWLLPLLLLAVSVWFLWKQYEKSKETSPNNPNSVAVITDSVEVNPVDSTANISVVKTDSEIDLNGIKIKGYSGGMEDRMISFLKSDGYKTATDDEALKTTWYDFDKVNFKMGSSTELEEGSQEQLDNLVAILKAFPNAKIKIGGYTDKTGDETTNLKISKARAEYIKTALSKAGVGSQVLAADGYGSEFAKVDATASDEERAIDRKMSVRFAK